MGGIKNEAYLLEVDGDPRVGSSTHSAVQVSFDELPQNAKQTAKGREEFWFKSKRLQKGTLVSLWREVPDAAGVAQPVITFATVVDREPKQLAPSDPYRPSIGIRCDKRAHV